MEVKVPSVGESVTEVTIGEWLEAVGSWVDVDQPIVSVESDKADMEIPAPVAGTIKEVLKAAGDDADVGEVIAVIEPGDKPKGTKAKSAKAEAKKAPEANGAAHVMPAAERVLAEAGKTADGIQGTGPGGRVLKEDAVKAVSEKGATTTEAKAKAPAAFRRCGVQRP